MKPLTWWLIATILAICISNSAGADVTVTNQTGEILFISTGQVVGGRVVYGGWTTIANGGQAKVYTGKDPQIMVSAVSIRNGGLHSWFVANHFASAELTVSTDNYRCESLGGASPQWRMVTRAQNSVWVFDANHPWPADMNLATATFYVVRGDLDELFLPQ